jgi:golgi apyrase
VASYLAPLLGHAREHIPPSLHKETPIFLLATAGMRLLPFAQQIAVLNAACDFIRFHSNFRVDASDDLGHCGSSIRIISGEEEGLFGWIAVNYLMDQFKAPSDERTTYGFLDMGGASTQIAFEPSADERAKTKNLIDVRLRLIGGEEIHHQVFVTTWLGYGTNQARERYLARALEQNESTHIDGNVGDGNPVPDPCLPRSLQLREDSVYPGHNDPHDKKEHLFVGTGSFEQCLDDIAPLLNKDAPCPDVPCLFNGIHVPQINFSASHFIGVSEYWYSSEHVFGLGGAYNFEEFERAASEFCSRDWNDIIKNHESMGNQEAEDGHEHIGHISTDSKDTAWRSVEIPRLQMQCFKSAWIVNVLHNGIGLPRIVDAGGNQNQNSDEVVDKATEKGLGKPLMQSLDTIGDVAISWTLGKMVLEASREISPLSNDVPLGSKSSADSPPLKGVSNSNASQPSEHYLTPSLSGYYSDTTFGFLSYLIGLALLILLLCRTRRLMHPFFRKFRKKTLPFDGDNGYTLEDGAAYSPGGRRVVPFPSSPIARRTAQPILSRVLTLFRTWFSPGATPASVPLAARHLHSTRSPYRSSPPRSYSSPSLWTQKDIATQEASLYTYSSSNSMDFDPPRSATPPAYRPSQFNGHLGAPYSLPRSRNNSQMNLTTLTTRSGQRTPSGTSHDGD